MRRRQVNGHARGCEPVARGELRTSALEPVDPFGCVEVVRKPLLEGGLEGLEPAIAELVAGLAHHGNVTTHQTAPHLQRPDART